MLTAHRSKGLEWDLVVVAGVQEGRWPDVRRRGSLLDADRLGRHGLADPVPTAVRVAEERRLFYVACTRARSRLVVTAVAGTEGEGDQPSRFLDELGVPATARPGRPRRPLTLAALVGELRRTSVDPDATPELRDQAALRLARLADATDAEGRPLVPAASPTTWWGMRALSDGRTSRSSTPGQPVALSGSQLGDVLACPRQWFLNRQASAGTTRNSAASFGSVVHVLAQHSAGVPLEPEERSAYLEGVWDQIAFDANWLSAVERAEAEDALDRFVAWQEARDHLELLGTEVPFRCEVDAGGRRVLLTGTADRVERERDGRVRIVDFKTGRTAPAAADVAVQDQLGVYQLAVAAGRVRRRGRAGRAAVRGRAGLPAPAGEAERASRRSSPRPRWTTCRSRCRPARPPDPDGRRAAPTWVHQRLRDAAELITAERFDARVGPACRWCAFRASCPTQAVGRQVVA